MPVHPINLFVSRHTREGHLSGIVSKGWQQFQQHSVTLVGHSAPEKAFDISSTTWFNSGFGRMDTRSFGRTLTLSSIFDWSLTNFDMGITFLRIGADGLNAEGSDGCVEVCIGTVSEALA